MDHNTVLPSTKFETLCIQNSKSARPPTYISSYSNLRNKLNINFFSVIFDFKVLVYNLTDGIILGMLSMAGLKPSQRFLDRSDEGR